MGTRLVDEREHRRGLILGLTLAEVLLLLLFLIMLALSIPLKEFYDSTHLAHDEIHALREENATLKRLLAGRPDGIILRTSERSRKINKSFSILTDGQVDEFLSSLKPLLAEPEWLKSLEQFLQVATRIDPDDPPASIRRATAAIGIIAKNIKPEQLSALGPVVKNETRLRQFADLYHEAARINPDDPPAALRPLDEATAKNLPLAAALGKIDELPKDTNEAERKLREGLEALSRGEHNWPPIITLEDDRYRFKTLSAELTGNFEANLRKMIVPLLVQFAKEYRVNTIEVIGHTDEQKITPRNSNLDVSLLDVLHKNGNVSALVPADNAGLGLARATAVVRVLSLDERLKDYTLLPLSGGQLIGVDDKLTNGGGGDERERRRIEIRVRRANISEVTTGAVGSPAVAPVTPAQVPPSAPVQTSRTAPAQTSRPRQRVITPRWFTLGSAPFQPAPAR